ncbi:MAG: SOS response-associated peptidase [Pseudomonadota bacterium]
MCGRFVMTDPNTALASLFGASPANDLPEPPRYNICPTQSVAVIRSEAGLRHMVPMRWGFLPHWYKTPTDGPLLINARAESIAQKPAFRAACRARRCLLPATGFYEWTKDAEGKRLPWYITRADTAPLAFAAIWQDWSAKVDGAMQTHRTVAIVTTAAAPDMAVLHHRCPVVLAPEDWPKWLGEAGHGAAPLMTAPPEGTLAWHRVDVEVNSNRAQGDHLITPVAA